MSSSLIESVPKGVQTTIYDLSEHTQCYYCKQYVPRTPWGTSNPHLDECQPFIEMMERAREAKKHRVDNKICGECNKGDADEHCEWCKEMYHSSGCGGLEYYGVCRNCSKDAAGD